MLLITLFLYGFLAGCAGLLIQTLLIVLFGQDTALTEPTFFFVAVAALVEELMKFGFLIQSLRRFGDRLSTVPAALFGLGFAAVEVGLSLSASGSASTSPLLMLNILFHTGTTVALALALLRYGARSLTSWGILGATALLHLLYNLSRLSA